MDEKYSTTQQHSKAEMKGEKSEKKLEIVDKEEQMRLQISADEMRKKQQKKDEDPRITKFKNTEVKIQI